MANHRLQPNYTVEVDNLSKTEWSDLLSRFDDATIYQTWSYGAVRWGDKNLSHLALLRNGSAIAAAQIRIVRTPFLRTGLAYVSRGPLWQLKGNKRDLQVFRQIVAALRKEYVLKRRLVLWILPNEIDDGSEVTKSILKEEDFSVQHSTPPYKTILIDLSPPLEVLLQNLSKKWRENLRRAQRMGLQIEEGTNDKIYYTFMNLYAEMHARKKFVQVLDINQFAQIQRDLPDNLKMKVMIAKSNGAPVAGLISSALGNTGIPIFSATATKGLKLRGSYLLRWQMLVQLKECGFLFLDQGGIDAETNPGGYYFKAGMGGTPVSFIGHFDSCNDTFSRLITTSIQRFRNICVNTKILQKTLYRIIK